MADTTTPGVPGRLAPTARVTGHDKLRASPNFPAIHQRVLEGWPLPSLAKYIQEDLKEFDDISDEALVSMLKRYRASLPPADLVKGRLPTDFVKAQQAVDAGIDELAELDRLYRLQMKRIEIDGATEEKIRKLFGSMTQEIRVAAEILGRSADLKMELGLAKRSPTQVDINADVNVVAVSVSARYAKPGIERVLRNPESVRKVLGVLERVSQIAGRDEDDSYDEAKPSRIVEVEATVVEAETE